MMQYYYLNICKSMYIWNKDIMKPHLLHVMYNENENVSVIYLFKKCWLWPTKTIVNHKWVPTHSVNITKLNDM